MEFAFTDRVAIVTGAAHGIGRSIAVELARRGARVHAADILAGEVEETAAAAAAAGGACTAHAADATDERQVNALVEGVAGEHGGVHILVNCAGGVCGQVHRPIDSVPFEDWERIFRVNLHAAFLFTRAVAPHLKRQRYGRIVNISSGAGRTVSLTGIQAYASAKAGLIGFTRQCAQELGPWNVTVNSIAPGFVRSNPSTEKQWQSYGPEGQKALVESIPLRRLGRPEDIAYGVLFFASDYAAWVTGQTISIDGGKIMI